MSVLGRNNICNFTTLPQRRASSVVSFCSKKLQISGNKQNDIEDLCLLVPFDHDTTEAIVRTPIFYSVPRHSTATAITKNFCIL